MLSMFSRFAQIYFLISFYSFLSKDIKYDDFVLIKKPNSFPNIDLHSDLDIITINLNKFKSQILNEYSKLKILKIQETVKSKNHIQLNIIFFKSMILKIDIYDCNQQYLNINNEFKFLTDLIFSKEILNFNYIYKTYNINIPKKEFDIILRYNEYKTFPNKIHHLKEIKKYNSELISQINKDFDSFLSSPIVIS